MCMCELPVSFLKHRHLFFRQGLSDSEIPVRLRGPVSLGSLPVSTRPSPLCLEIGIRPLCLHDRRFLD